MLTIDWHLYVMAFMYIIAGFFHFVKPKVYILVMPSYIPYPETMVFISGLVEIILGVGLFFQSTKSVSIYFIVLMLLAFFTVHIHMLQSKKASRGIPNWILWLRIPLQFVLIWWAIFYL